MPKLIYNPEGPYKVWETECFPNCYKVAVTELGGSDGWFFSDLGLAIEKAVDLNRSEKLAKFKELERRYDILWKEVAHLRACACGRNTDQEDEIARLKRDLERGSKLYDDLAKGYSVVELKAGQLEVSNLELEKEVAHLRAAKTHRDSDMETEVTMLKRELDKEREAYSNFKKHYIATSRQLSELKEENINLKTQIDKAFRVLGGCPNP
jgi:hypothetical protein